MLKRKSYKTGILEKLENAKISLWESNLSENEIIEISSLKAARIYSRVQTRERQNVVEKYKHLSADILPEHKFLRNENSLLFGGKSRTGKTSLSYRLAHYYLFCIHIPQSIRESRKDTAIFSSKRYLNIFHVTEYELQDIYIQEFSDNQIHDLMHWNSDGGEQMTFRHLRNKVDCLVIQDFGTVSGKQAGFIAAMDGLIDARLNDPEKMTIVTTNRSLLQIEEFSSRIAGRFSEYMQLDFSQAKSFQQQSGRQIIEPEYVCHDEHYWAKKEKEYRGII